VEQKKVHSEQSVPFAYNLTFAYNISYKSNWLNPQSNHIW
jgi:hypothetical protein